uniref:SapC family protein n=1 Tax=Caldimicrobium thiodismutans TaxID=1653476 RepID=A0A832LY61_9BACT
MERLMLEPIKAFKKPVLLEVEKHLGLGVKRPENYAFAQEVEVVPLTFSELLPISMYYPVVFGIAEGKIIYPFAVLGFRGKNIYLNEEGHFKVPEIPKIIKHYPFGVIRETEENREDWLILIDEACLSEDAEEKLFEANGEESEFMKKIKEELTELALDFAKAYQYAQELADLRLLKLLPEFVVNTKLGIHRFKNILIGDAEALKNISPERLYYLNTSGYLPILYSIYLSVRNFVLFDFLIC